MPTFFETAEAFAGWLEKHGAAESELNTATLERSEQASFKKAKAAWKFFEAQPRGYRHLVIWRIVSAKRPETRERRLAALIEASKEKRRL